MPHKLEQRILAFSSPPTPWRAKCTEGALYLAACVSVTLSQAFLFAGSVCNKRSPPCYALATIVRCQNVNVPHYSIPPRFVTAICVFFARLFSTKKKTPVPHPYHLLLPQGGNISGSQDTRDEACVVREPRSPATVPGSPGRVFDG